MRIYVHAYLGICSSACEPPIYTVGPFEESSPRSPSTKPTIMVIMRDTFSSVSNKLVARTGSVMAIDPPTRPGVIRCTDKDTVTAYMKKGGPQTGKEDQFVSPR